MKVSILTGIVDQLTIFGQLEFIHGNEYDCSNSGSGDDIVTTVVGDFKVVGSDDIERVEVKMTPQRYVKHIKLS
jgi:hypothetical protein